MFNVECVQGSPYTVEGENALIPIRFRHFGPNAIELNKDLGEGTLNLGFKLISDSANSLIFEDRIVNPGRMLTYDENFEFTVVIPSNLISFLEKYVLIVDLVYENKYWFGEKNLSAPKFEVEFVSRNNDAFREVEASKIMSIESYLARAYARISELEYTEKSLRTEREYYRSQCEALARLAEANVASIAALPPAASLVEKIVESINVVQRRDQWIAMLSKVGLEGQIFGFYPHGGKSGNRQLLVYGSGGYGDMVYLTPIVRELFSLFAPCSVVVLHENKNVADVFENNPYVSAYITLSGEMWRTFVETAHYFDVFDALIDVRYVVTYVFPPLSRISLNFRLRAQYSGAEYQKYVRFAAWPKLNNVLANLVTSRGMHKLDLVGQTSLLPIDRHSDLDVFVPEASMFDWEDAAGRAFITIHHGADRNMAVGKRIVQTKNCTVNFWRQFVALAKSNGFVVVQLGQMGEEYIEGIDLDLRGKTTLSETAAVIKLASAHVDTEGGLVHLARGVQNRSVVMFGPTPVAFFGYPQNINIGPKICGNCWWTTEDWSKTCPRDLAEPECMSSHVPSEIISAVSALVMKEKQMFSLLRCESKSVYVEHIFDPDLRNYLEELDEKGAIVIGPGRAPVGLLELMTTMKSSTMVYVNFMDFAFASQLFGGKLRLCAYSLGNFPAPDQSLSQILAVDLDIRNVKGATFCADLARCVQRDGQLVVRAANETEAIAPTTWLAHFASACERIPGGRFSGVFSPPFVGSGADATVLYLTFAAQPAASGVEVTSFVGRNTGEELGVVTI